MLGAGDEIEIERFMEVYKEEKRKIKRFIYLSKKEVNEQFVRKMNQDVSGNMMLFWKMSKVNGGNVEGCSRIKYGNRMLVLGEDEVRRIWKDILKIFIV